jgi:enamine deaminase RidA (YjgF/YER057c/UK114 family)
MKREKRAMSGQVEAKIEQLGHRLPAAPEAVGFYVPVLKTGNLVVTSGQLPFMGKELVFKGKVGSEIHEEDGINAARICVLNALAQIKACVGDLDKVTRIVRLEGFVQSAEKFRNQPHILNGASQFLADVFGEKGRHTRTAIGVSEMPLNAAVQIALWAEVDE